MLSEHTLSILRRAKEHLLTHGWIQGELGEPGTPTCLNGAVFAVAGPGRAMDAIKALGFAINIDGWSITVPMWNDAPERTFEDVIALIDKTLGKKNV